MDPDQIILSPVFKGMSHDDFAGMMASYSYKMKTYHKEDILAMAGDLCDHLMVLMSGSVRGEMIDYSGKVIKIEDVMAPMPIAGAFLFGRKTRFPVTVTANEDTTVFIMHKTVFLSVMQEYSVVLTNYLNLISGKAQFLSDKIRFLSFKTLRQKIAHFLLTNLPEGNTLEIPYTQMQLSELFGVARPSLAREFGEMEKDGLITVNRRQVEVKKKPELEILLRQ